MLLTICKAAGIEIVGFNARDRFVDNFANCAMRTFRSKKIVEVVGADDLGDAEDEEGEEGVERDLMSFLE